MPLELVDRERERAELRELAQAPGNHLAILYGRRQVGKTFLLSRTWDDRPVFYFLAADTLPDLNRRDFLRELSAWTGQALEPTDYPTWRTLFRLLIDLARPAPLVTVIDEFQYLVGGDDDAASQLVAVWDREAAGRPLTLVLCGSEVSTMEGLIAGGQPLYGRASWSARLTPFDYRDAARMLGNRLPRELALFYGILGGMPRYLAAVEPEDALAPSIVRAFVSPRGEVHLQLATLIEQEKGIRHSGEYRAVLDAIATGCTEVNEIAQQATLGGQPHVVRRVLQVLEGLEIVERKRSYDSSTRAPHRFGIADNAVRFWHRFLIPNRSRLALGDPGEVWDSAIQPYLNDYMGPVFERIVVQAYRRYHPRWGLPPARIWSDWVGKDRNRRNIQLDVVAELDDGSMLTGEIKWSSTPRGFDLHNSLERNLDDLARSGHGWARVAQDGPRLYASAAGFTDEFRRWAEDKPRVRLVTFEELYPE